MPKKKTVVGWKEFVALPDWGIKRLRAKIDTGARTSAIHVEDIVPLPDGRLSFRVVENRLKPEKSHTVEAEIVRRTVIRSSTGTEQLRYIVSTKIILGGVEKTVELSLVSRRKMLHRMLIGRTTLADDFLVDVNEIDHLASLEPVSLP